MRASVVITSHNESDDLLKTVQSCLQYAPDFELEVIVSYNDRAETPVRELVARFPHIRALKSQSGTRVSILRDVGARNARGEVLIFLDANCKPEPGALAELIADSEGLGENAILTGSLAAIHNDTWTNNVDQLGHGRWMDLEMFDHGWLALDEMRPRSGFYESPAIAGAGIALNRSLYQKLGGFDPVLADRESQNLDLSLKAWLLGYGILHDPKPVIGHLFHHSSTAQTTGQTEIIADRLHLARKHFTEAVCDDWVEHCRLQCCVGAWERAWSMFNKRRNHVERERSRLIERRVHDEFWFAEKFGLSWPISASHGDSFSGYRNDPLADPRWLVLNHWKQPRNRAGSGVSCLPGFATTSDGTTITLFLALARLSSGEIQVENASYIVEGSGVVSAYASMFTDWVRGRSVPQIRRLSAEDAVRSFGTGAGLDHILRASKGSAGSLNGATEYTKGAGSLSASRTAAALLVAALQDALLRL